MTVKKFILQDMKHSQGYKMQHNLILTTNVKKYENVFFHTYFPYELPVNTVLLHFRTVSDAMYCVRHMHDVPGGGCTLTFSWLSFVSFSQFSATYFKTVHTKQLKNG
jgi:hypothetical protein